MSFTAALVILAQSAAPQAAPTSSTAPVSGASSTSSTPIASSRGVSVQVRASAQIIRPTRVTMPSNASSTLEVSGSQSAHVQRSRDAAGTLWVDFS